MRKFAKPILIASGVLVAGFILFVIAVNLYLQSAAVQQRIRTASSEAAGMPVEIRSTAYIPWSGLVVSGVAVPLEGGGRLPLLNVASVSIRFGFSSLMQGRFAVSEVLVNNPVLLVHQKSDGSWSRPARYPVEVPASVNEAAVPSVEGEPLVVTAPPAEPAAVEMRGPAVSLEQIRVRDGSAFFDDAIGRRLVSFDGVGVVLKPAPDGTVSGNFKVRRIEWFGIAVLRDVRGSFLWKPDYFSIPGFEADWAHGLLSGRFDAKLGDERRFSGSAEAADVQIQQLASDAGMSSDGSRGTLFGEARLAGVPGQPRTFTGGAEVELRSATLEPVDFVRQIGDLAGIEELQLLRLKEARAMVTVVDEKVMADKILLESTNLVIDASGPVGFDGSLDLAAKIHFNEKLRRDLRAVLGKNLAVSDREGYKALPFSVSGTVSRPESDLLEKLLGMKIGRDMGNVLQNLLSLPSGSRSQKARPQEDGTPPAP